VTRQCAWGYTVTIGNDGNPMIALNDHYESIIRTNLIPMLIIKKY
jgi:hypothetical protein